MTTPTTPEGAEIALPALPELGGYDSLALEFTAVEMQAYARQAIIADRAARAAQAVPEGWLREAMSLAREAGDLERRHCIGKAHGFDVRDAYAELESHLAAAPVPADSSWRTWQARAALAAPLAPVGAVPVAWRHSATLTLHDTEDEVQLADGDERAEPLYLAAPAASAVQPLTDAQIEDLLHALDAYAGNVDRYEYGLPLHDEHPAAMRKIVRDGIAAAAGQGEQS